MFALARSAAFLLALALTAQATALYHDNRRTPSDFVVAPSNHVPNADLGTLETLAMQSIVADWDLSSAQMQDSPDAVLRSGFPVWLLVFLLLLAGATSRVLVLFHPLDKLRNAYAKFYWSTFGPLDE